MEVLEHGGGLRDEDEAEAGVCGTQEWKDLADVGKGEGRRFTSPEEEANEDRMSVGMGGTRGRSGMNLFYFVAWQRGGRQGKAGNWKMG